MIMTLSVLVLQNFYELTIWTKVGIWGYVGMVSLMARNHYSVDVIVQLVVPTLSRFIRFLM